MKWLDYVRLFFTVLTLPFSVVKELIVDAVTHRKWIRLDAAQALALSDEELLDCTLYRVFPLRDWHAAQQQPHCVQMLYVLIDYFTLMEDGGLYEYLLNTERETVPVLEGALAEVGAEAYREQFHAFMTENGIDVHDLSRFDVEDDADFAELDKLPFDAFEDAFLALEEEQPPEKLWAGYIRANAEHFFKCTNDDKN